MPDLLVHLVEFLSAAVPDDAASGGEVAIDPGPGPQTPAATSATEVAPPPPEPTSSEANPASGGGELFGLQRTVFTLVALGVVLVLLALLFMTRRFLGWIMNTVFLLLGTLLVIVALFGHQLGIYDAIEAITSAAPEDDEPVPLP